MKQNDQDTKRWWNYQLVRLQNDEHDCCVIYEIHWKQEKGLAPKIWMCRNVDLIATNAHEMLVMLNNIIQDVQYLDILSEDMLPSDEYSEIEYQRVLAEVESHGKS